MLPLAGFPVVFPMWSVAKSLGVPAGLRRFLDMPNDGRVLVLVQLAGGNDGINTTIPHGHDAYFTNRPNLAIPKEQILDLNKEIGFHPSLANLRPLYDNSRLAIVQGVGYPNPDRSHFKSTDIWLTASNSNEVQDTGWLGRYFDLICPPDEEGNEQPCGVFGPPAVQIGLTSSLALLGRNPKGIALQDPLAFYNLVNRQGHGGDPGPAPETTAGRELEFLRETAAAAFQYAGEILQASENATNSITYPSESLAAQLAIVARLIAGGLTTRVYIVSIKGFDTHASQLAVHSTLLASVANALNTFQQDLQNLGVAEKVVGMCFSEFGRRVYENASIGTDHGTAAPLILFGSAINGGIYGAHPSLTDLENGDLKHIYDFRQIYATLLQDWLMTDPAPVLGGAFSTLPLINNTTGVREEEKVPREFYLAQNYPNPFNPSTTIEYGLARDSDVELIIVNAVGQKVATLVSCRQTAGVHRATWRVNGHASGIYFMRLRASGFEQTRTMQVVK
jgi:uncharacterized protein (DUF1501 family)